MLCVRKPQKLSIVWILSLDGFSIIPQFILLLLAMAARASSMVFFSWRLSGVSVKSCESLNALITRVRICNAAFLVNVIHRISSGLDTIESSLKNLCTRSSVFPEPAGDCTIKDFSGSKANFLVLSSFSIGLIRNPT